MATSDTKNTGRLIDWIILVFVLVVMGLLIVDLAGNVRDTVGIPDSTTDEPEVITKERPQGPLLDIAELPQPLGGLVVEG